MVNFGKKDKVVSLNPAELIVERIIRWYRTPRKMEVQDVAYQLDKDLKVTDQELYLVENKVKSGEEEAPKNFYFFIKRMIIAERKNSNDFDEKLCQFNLCNGSGYRFANHITGMFQGMAFKCKCNTRRTKLVEWDEKFSKEYILEA